MQVALAVPFGRFSFIDDISGNWNSNLNGANADYIKL